MKKLVFMFLAVASLLLTSCGTPYKIIGTYSDGNEFEETSLSYEEVWSKIIDYFAVSGIPITNIDKSSGIIVSNNVSFENYYTREDKQGNLVNPNAFVVIPTIKGGFGNILEPNATLTGEWEMYGDWNVRIKPNGKGGTIVNVNLLNLRCFYGGRGMLGKTKIPIKSTGIFEKMMLDYLK